MSEVLLNELLDRYAQELPEQPGWDDVLRRARRRRRRILVLAVLAIGAVLVPSALAISTLRHVFEGRTAPRSVARGFERNAAMPAVVPAVDQSSAHGVLAARSLDGPVYLWAANERSGHGKCWFATWAHDLRYPWLVATAWGCDPAKRSTSIAYSYSWQVPHWAVAVLVGRVYANAATVKVRYGCKQTRVVPVVEHLFMTTFLWSTRIYTLTAHDQRGRVTAERSVPWRPSPGGPTDPNSALSC